TISGSQGPAIDFRNPVRRAGDRVRIVENHIGPNCRRDGRAEIVIPAGLDDVYIGANTITTAVGTPALFVDGGSKRIAFTGNRVNGRPQQLGDVAGDVESVAMD